jgi:hypothetical protein
MRTTHSLRRPAVLGALVFPLLMAQFDVALLMAKFAVAPLPG